ncbi:MAG: substrate-binding domain-containing protein [Kiritimatiellae bacterium]|nr:substrate-binding domain-containing protein [Kiritimatiellia bacterium]
MRRQTGGGDNALGLVQRATDEFAARLAKGRKWLPDLLFFRDDHLATGALVALSVAGVRIPEDVRVVTWANRDLGPAFAAGVNVGKLPKWRQGCSRIEFAKDRVSPDWAWYDIGKYDFSALQKIRRPTMDGLSLYIEGEVEVDKVEIAKVK